MSISMKARSPPGFWTSAGGFPQGFAQRLRTAGWPARGKGDNGRPVSTDEPKKRLPDSCPDIPQVIEDLVARSFPVRRKGWPDFLRETAQAGGGRGERIARPILEKPGQVVEISEEEVPAVEIRIVLVLDQTMAPEGGQHPKGVPIRRPTQPVADLQVLDEEMNVQNSSRSQLEVELISPVPHGG